MLRSACLLFVIVSVAVPTFAAEPVRLPITRDAWISAFPSEQEGNNGAAPRLKFKGIQEFSLLDFDAAVLRGQRIVRAELWLHLESNDAPLGRMTVSTVATAWEEGTGTGYAKETGASFRWAAPNKRWSDRGPDITSAVNGQSGTHWGFGDTSPPDAKGWQTVPVDPKVIEECADGRSHGLLVQDDLGSEYERDGETFKYRLFPNRFVASRDMNKLVAPYLLVWTDGAATQPVIASHFTVQPDSSCKLPDAVRGHSVANPSLLMDLKGVPLGDRLTAARNETIAFFITRQAGETVELETPGLTTRLYGIEKDVLTRPTAQGRIVGEIHIPHTARAGMHEVTIRVGKRTQPVQLQVWDFTLPDQLSFVPEMNAYGLPVAADAEIDWYRLAHEHRLNLNVLRYGWNGNVADGCAPQKQGGKWDWTAWDARFGPLLDGSAFRDLPRAGVPLDAFYLPLNEHWPADVHRHFKGGYWIENAFDDSYWQAFSAAAHEFAEHAKSRGWNQTWLQFYLNNKLYFKEQRGTWSSVSAPWIFDEPVNTQDFWALRMYGQQFNRATRKIAPNLIFRCDISRPEWQRDLLDGVTGMEVISGALRPYRDRIAQRQKEFGTMVTFYGSTAPPSPHPIQPVAWCLDAWCLGADGVLPWQTIGSKDSWDKPDELSLFYPARNPQDPPVSASLRLKSYREGQQLVEYLTCFAQTSGNSRASVAAAVTEFIGLQGRLKKKNEEDAGTLEYNSLQPAQIMELRERLGSYLDSKHPEPKSRRVTWDVKTEETTREVIKLDR